MWRRHSCLQRRDSSRRFGHCQVLRGTRDWVRVPAFENMVPRRTFVTAALAAPFGLASERELQCDVAIVGGGVGGCAAALGALRNGMRVILTEETDWLGGQLTSQAVPPDEHPWIEMFGCTASYRRYRQAVRQYYRRNYPPTARARSIENLNPGGGGGSR